jgi:hypothetical protein
MPELRLIERTCRGCGKIERGPTRYMSAAYCSKECWRKHAAGKHLRTGKTLVCQHCGGAFYTRGASVKRGAKFCSVRCAEDSRAIKHKTCSVCDVPFRPKNRSSRFCSYACSKTGKNNPNWVGGTQGRKVLAADKEWRRAVFERDAFTCQCCGQWGGRLNAHHLDSYHWNEGWRHVVSNGVTLCTKCHNRFHREFGRKWNTRQQWQDFLAGNPATAKAALEDEVL